MKFNVVSNEGEQTSVVVFIGAEQLLATNDHPNFTRILAELATTNPNEAFLRELFDTGIAIERKFLHLSERVMVKQGHVYFDGVHVDNTLTDAILRFQFDGQEDFMPLVNFMEKIETNPSEHSREHLFRWLSKHKFALHPDGDFIAYKGVDKQEMSITSGSAIVNGVLVNGKVPNQPGTVVEMPRDQVTFDPHNGCAVGLHAGNWRYAHDFAQSHVLRVKINPRDVVSVPVDSNFEKLRVCRYRIIDRATAEDKTMLVLSPDKTKAVDFVALAAAQPETQVRRPRVRKSAPKKEMVYPDYYEEYTKRHFDTLPISELRWLAKEWEVQPERPLSKDNYVKALLKEARARKRTW